MSGAKTLTTSAGAPIADNQNSRTAGARGPVLLQDYQLIEKLALERMRPSENHMAHAGVTEHPLHQGSQEKDPKNVVAENGAAAAAFSLNCFTIPRCALAVPSLTWAKSPAFTTASGYMA